MKKNIILGVTGSIAAYKAADIANTLTKEGHSVHVIMTKAGMEFITPLTMQTLTKKQSSHRPVCTLCAFGSRTYFTCTEGRSVSGGSGKCRFYRKSCCRDSR